jgi:hypothetical protein
MFKGLSLVNGLACLGVAASLNIGLLGLIFLSLGLLQVVFFIESFN